MKVTLESKQQQKRAQKWELKRNSEIVVAKSDKLDKHDKHAFKVWIDLLWHIYGRPFLTRREIITRFSSKMVCAKPSARVHVTDGTRKCRSDFEVTAAADVNFPLFVGKAILGFKLEPKITSNHQNHFHIHPHFQRSNKNCNLT